MAFKKSKIIEKVKRELTLAFLIVDMEFISFYLVLRVDQGQKRKTIKLSQPVYIEKLIA